MVGLYAYPVQRAPALYWVWGRVVSGKLYPRLCNARRPRLKPGTFRSQAVRLYRLHQARPSVGLYALGHNFSLNYNTTKGFTDFLGSIDLDKSLDLSLLLA